jgi:hypothetical protein
MHVRRSRRVSRRHEHRRSTTPDNQTTGDKLVVGREHGVAGDPEQTRQYAARRQSGAISRSAIDRVLDLPADLAAVAPVRSVPA